MPNARFEVKEGVVFLYGNRFNLKLDNNRNVYYQKDNDSKFKSMGCQIERGYTLQEKKSFLYKLNIEILRRVEDSNTAIANSTTSPEQKT